LAGGIFVSYRRDDAAHVTGRLADALAARFGRSRVFIDVDSVAPGEDFVRKIEATVAGSRVFLAVIGPNWLSAAATGGGRRVDQPGDFIRLEVVSALKAGVKIIPVLVDGASMPRAEDLPEEMAQLTRHNAVHLSHTTFQRDAAALVAGLAGPGIRRALHPRMVAGAAGALAVAAMAVALWPKADAGAAQDLAFSLSLKDEPPAAQRWITEVVYRAERDAAGQLAIRADLPYRDRLFGEHRADGLAFVGAPIDAPAPVLSAQLHNATAKPIAIAELQFEVVDAAPDIRPLPVVRESPILYRQIRVVNEGWSAPSAPRLVITGWGLPETDPEKIAPVSASGLSSYEPCANPTEAIGIAPLTIEGVVTPNEEMAFDLGTVIPPAYDGHPAVCAIGEMSWSGAGGDQRVAVRTRVDNDPGGYSAAGLIIGMYDLYLDPERKGYTAVVPAMHLIQPGETLAVEITVKTDRTSTFRLRPSVRLGSGRIVAGEAFSLEAFTPRHNHRSYNLNDERRQRLPAIAVMAEDPAGWVEQATYDAQGREPVRIQLRRAVSPDVCRDFVQRIGWRILERAGRRDQAVEVAGPEGQRLCEAGQGY
jgi:hypothetical protein